MFGYGCIVTRCLCSKVFCPSGLMLLLDGSKAPYAIIMQNMVL